MKKIAFILLFFPFCIFAQINESDTSKFQSRTSLTGNWQGGNVEFLAFRAKIDISTKFFGQLVFKTQNAYLYQEFFRQKADEDIFSRNFVYVSPQNRFYAFGLAWISTNFRRKIDFRYFTGLGATYQLVQQKNHVLKIAFSGVYEQSNFRTNTFNETFYNNSFQITTWRFSAWLFGKNHFMNDKLIFHYEAYLQPSLQRKDNFRWQTEIGFDAKIFKNIAFTTNFVYTYESVVAEKLKNEDYMLSFGLSFYLKK